MALSGLFVTLFDKDTLKLYLNKGIYGMHMRPIYAEVPGRSQHYAALADYGCSREGTHVFFFLKREIIYGGQIIGNKDYGSFYLNGIYSPLGRKTNAEVFWDESDRSCYKKTGKEGIFIRPEIDENEVCQPYIILFEDNLGFKGNAISSDQLYFELGKFPFPLPTNSISGMGFCTMTPGETRIALDLIENSCKKKYEYSEVESIHIKNCRTIYQPNFDVRNLMECQTESHLEASVVSNPSLLPHEL